MECLLWLTQIACSCVAFRWAGFCIEINAHAPPWRSGGHAMGNGNGEYLRANCEVEGLLKKPESISEKTASTVVSFELDLYKELAGRRLPRGSAVLDFGCGTGATVRRLLEMGCEAHGVDILEYWGRDRALCGAAFGDLPEALKARLHLADPATSTLPFADGSFELIVSNMVLEHVFDHAATFREQVRVLKPGGMAIHRFPKATGLLETHTGVPLVALNRYRWYLALWALGKWRNARQKGLSWRDTLRSSEALYRTTHYVGERKMLAMAREAGAEARFMDFLPVYEGRMGQLYRQARRVGLGWAAGPVLRWLSLNHVLVLKRPAAG
jgi:SAM-dependent methyltransferase